MPKKIIIVRHGETEWNVTRRLQGWSDIPLNKNGREQAMKVAQRLSGEIVDAIYTSDHKRAHATAANIAKRLGIKPSKRTALREDRMGILEGWQWETEPDKDKEQLWQQRDIARSTGDLLWKPEGGESLQEHTERVSKFIQQLEAKHQNDTVIVVSHGGTINRIMEIHGFKKITEEYIRFQNTSVTILTKTKTGYRLDLLNDITHLNMDSLD